MEIAGGFLITGRETPVPSNPITTLVWVLLVSQRSEQLVKVTPKSLGFREGSRSVKGFLECIWCQHTPLCH